MNMKRITKREAFKRFCAEKPFWLCPCKLRFGFPWYPEYLLSVSSIKAWKDSARLYRPGYFHCNSELWKGTVNATAWYLMYRNWVYCNANWETGYYAHYYIKTH